MDKTVSLPVSFDWNRWLNEKIRAERQIVWLDCTDFVQYAEGGNTTVSGIQRVVANLVTHAERSGLNVIPVIPEFDRMRVLAASPAAVEDLVRTLQSGSATRGEISELLRRTYDSRIQVEPRRGDLFVMAGAFWIYRHHDILLEMRHRGVGIALFVHDLIQLTNPEYLSAVANKTFRQSLVDVLAVVDLVMANSNYVAGEVRQYLKERLNLNPPIVAVPLPTELPASIANVPEIGRKVLEIAKTEFVLCVGTIEIRKNHILLIKIWEKMLAQTNVAVPNLVFVGKWGWNIDELQSYLQKNNYVGKWLHVFNDLPDSDLNYLYEKCLLTTYPSFAEGWGLPVGESLAHGKPCVASNLTSIPEVGGEFARYIDPFDVRSGFETFHELFKDREIIRNWARDIEKRFIPKTWDQFCSEFYSALAAAPANVSTTNANYIFSSGLFYSFGNRDLPKLDALQGSMITPRMNRVSGWHPIDDQMVWTRDSFALLSFNTDLPEGEEVFFYFRAQSNSDNSNFSLFVNAGEGEVAIGNLPTLPVYRCARGRIVGNGVLNVTFVAAGGAGSSKVDGKGLVGLHSIAFCVRADSSKRIQLLEKMAMDGPVDSVEAIRHELSAGDDSSLRDDVRFMVRFISSGISGGLLSAASWRLRLEIARWSARRKQWKRAERQYARLLRTRPDRTAVWKQYGHMLKEQRLMIEARQAYGIALDLDRSDEDSWTHYRYACSEAKRDK